MLRFGDVLRYGPDQDSMELLAWRFMFIATHRGFNQVLVLAIEPDDDQWVPAETIISAGINELVLADG